MVDIVVIRGAGDYPGNDVSEPLASSVAVARELGRSIIDDAEPGDDMQLTAAYLPELRLGKTLYVVDAWGEPAYNCKITGIRHVAGIDADGNPQLTTEITARRPRAYR